jgi:Fic family protein
MAVLDKKAIGYQALIEQLELSVIPHYRRSYVTNKGRGYTHFGMPYDIHVYPINYALKDPNDSLQQIEFAIKYDGINLEILLAVFKKLDVKEIEIYIHQQPGGKYARIIWFLYEFLTGEIINVPALSKVAYVNILDPELYYTAPGIKSNKHKIYNNLLGNKDFCPIIRKTKFLQDYIFKGYDIAAKQLTAKYSPHLIARASKYLFTKETLSSYEIEREKPSKERMERFINLLQTASINKLTKELLIELQNAIVDSRFKDVDYRITQNYIGENIDSYYQKLHYISPKPENVASLMHGLLLTLDTAINTEIHPVLIAAMIAFGFVFVHPFEDGNGRIHRFLIHYILSRTGFTPPGIIFPISAVMLKKIMDYDAILESFSKPLLELMNNYELSDDGVLTVQQDTVNYYRYLDYTKFAEYLFACIDETLQNHFENEIKFLLNYDRTKLLIQNKIDMPDRLIDLFIKFVIQNHGVLAKQKQEKYFNMLTEIEIANLQLLVKENML